MRSPTILACAALLVLACGVVFADGKSPPTAGDPGHAAPLYPTGTNAEYSFVTRGDDAPDFSYEAAGGRWLRLRDLRAQGHVLLVIAPDDERLRALERERRALLALGVVPVAVLDMKSSRCRSIAERLQLGYTVVPDPQRVIGAQFNALEPRSRQDAPAWVVVDRKGRVRGLGRFEWPEAKWTQVAATSLGLPVDVMQSPASTRAR